MQGRAAKCFLHLLRQPQHTGSDSSATAKGISVAVSSLLELQHHSLENNRAFILVLCRLNTPLCFIMFPCLLDHLSIHHHLHFYRKVSHPSCCSSSVFVFLISLHTKQKSWVSFSSWSPEPEGKSTKPINSFISSNLTCSDVSLLFLPLLVSLCPSSDWFLHSCL